MKHPHLKSDSATLDEKLRVLKKATKRLSRTVREKEEDRREQEKVKTRQKKK